MVDTLRPLSMPSPSAEMGFLRADSSGLFFLWVRVWTYEISDSLVYEIDISQIDQAHKYSYDLKRNIAHLVSFAWCMGFLSEAQILGWKGEGMAQSWSRFRKLREKYSWNSCSDHSASL